MADELDQLQEQEEWLNGLHIQAARQRCRTAGASLRQCECCGERIEARRRKAILGVRTCTECQRALEIRGRHYMR